METQILHRDRKHYQIAYGLSVFTILYNLAEGLGSTFLGFEDGSLALLGFGSDSFIEVISGLGIAHMVLRIRENPLSKRDQFEKRALQITGIAFYILVIGLVISSSINLWNGHAPETTLWGLIISVLSIVVMSILVSWKRKVGKALNSEPILADANCTLVCIYMSIILLFSSGLYLWIGIPYIDSLGTLALAYFALKEGNECFEKAKSEKYCSCSH
ncbi:cation transporter [Marinilongibacter aquaticus]|uniref:cation transporter n=1 Tax=Marinilongibacter aquaticus TaxID=2975157 RepID=UPI0021BD24E9|nr:cation transporter [Marinilongibacter aquaticus]UBM58061.1 cation transporter [Marinilongibacter aquaticus]